MKTSNKRQARRERCLKRTAPRKVKPNNVFRTDDPSTGRYIESDPIGLEGGLNTFTYVGGNPTLLFDVLGLAYSEEECRKLLQLINEQYLLLMIYRDMEVTGELRQGVKIGTYANVESDCSTVFPDEGRRKMCEAHEQYHSDNWHRLRQFPLWFAIPFGGDKSEFMKRQGQLEAEATRAGIDVGEKLYEENCNECQ